MYGGFNGVAAYGAKKMGSIYSGGVIVGTTRGVSKIPRDAVNGSACGKRECHTVLQAAIRSIDDAVAAKPKRKSSANS